MLKQSDTGYTYMGSQYLLIPIEQYGRCAIANTQKQGKLAVTDQRDGGCTSKCKHLTKEYDIILDTKKVFVYKTCIIC